MFSNIRDAFGSIRKALTERGGESPLSRYTVTGGAVFARSTGMTAVAPCDFFGDASFSVAAKEIDAALDKLAQDVDVTFAKDVLTLRAGRARAAIKTTSADHSGIDIDAVEMGKPPEGVVDVLKALVPFGDPGSQPAWTASVIMRPSYTAVTRSGKALAIADVNIGLGLMPLEAADYMVSREAPTEWRVTDDAIYARWADGAWAKLSLISGAVPAVLDTLVTRAEKTPTWAPTAEWREAFARVAGLSDGKIRIEATGLSGIRGSMAVDEAVATDMEDSLLFSVEHLTLCVERAELIGFPAGDRVPPNVIPWRGSGIRGLISPILSGG